MKVKLISIGNSKGIRIPSSVIEQCGLGNELEMSIDAHGFRDLKTQSPSAFRKIPVFWKSTPKEQGRRLSVNGTLRRLAASASDWKLFLEE